MYLEKFVEQARHIEVQIFGDGRGGVMALGERDCSAQRRNQKVIEETPAPGIGEDVRRRLFDAAVRLGRAVQLPVGRDGRVSFTTMRAREFYFLEVNTRLQVEHGVTEEVTGVDLVEWMVRLAAGEAVPLDRAASAPRGCSHPGARLRRGSGEDFPAGRGPDLARRMAGRGAHRDVGGSGHGGDAVLRSDAGEDDRARRGPRGGAREDAHGAGAMRGWPASKPTSPICARSGDAPGFAAGGITTSFLRDFAYRRTAIEVVEPGTQTTVQDFPGRLGYWHVGVPPSGPMDSLAFRLANRLVGNAEDAAGLEIAVTGPALRFSVRHDDRGDGRGFRRALDGSAIPRWTAVAVQAGSLLEMGTVGEAGSRAYLAVAGGIDVPSISAAAARSSWAGSAAMRAGALRAGDVLHIGRSPEAARGPRKRPPEYGAPVGDRRPVRAARRARLLHGGRTSSMFFSTAWKVHYNSDRTGMRLIGPKPQWARKDGGEAGLHPSNIHDNAYAVGTVDFTGDMPVILGPDGPSLGGFVCPATIVHAELWKIGQLRPGDLVRFHAMSLDEAQRLEREMDAAIEARRRLPRIAGAPQPSDSPVLGSRAGRGVPRRRRPVPAGRVRPQRSRSEPAVPRARARERAARARRCRASSTSRRESGRCTSTTTRRACRREALLEALEACEREIPDLDDIDAPSRVVHLPLSWDDPATQLAIRKYMQSVRPDAPWCPSNIEFIRRINGLDSHRRSAADRVRRELPGAGAGRRLPGSAGGDAGRSAPSPGDDEIQSGAHLDSGERGGHRRRVSLRVRHGRAGRLSVRGADGADVEHVRSTPSSSRARRGCCASSIRFVFIR